MPREVPRIGRVLDVVGLVVFLAGGAVAGWSWLQLHRLREDQPASAGLDFAAVARANRLTELSWIGVAVMAAGLAVAVAAAVVARRAGGDGD